MSVKVMGMIWDFPLPSSEKLILLAYADHADHDGNNIWPSIGLVARKTGLSRRTVQRITKKLQERDPPLLILQGKGGGVGRTNRWKIPLENLKPPDQNGDTMTPIVEETASGDPQKVSMRPSKGDTMTPEPSLIISNHHEREGEGDNGLREFLKLNMGPHSHLLERATVFVAADTGDLRIYTSSGGKREYLTRRAIQAMMQDAMEGYLGYSGKIEIW
jgi:hypothetical protein